MTLKWVSALVAATSLSIFGTANLIATLVPDAAVPFAINLLLVAAAAAASVLTVVAELYQRLDARLSVMSDFLVTRLDDIVGRLDDIETARGFDAILTPPEVVPFTPRVARARPSDNR